MWNHKIKLLLLGILVYLLRKCWLIYKQYVKPFLDIGGQMLKGSAAGAASGKKTSEDAKAAEEDDDFEDLYYDEVDQESAHEDR